MKKPIVSLEPALPVRPPTDSSSVGAVALIAPYVPPDTGPFRRRRGSGSFLRMTDRLWCGRVELEPGPAGNRRRRQVTHRTFCGMLKKFSVMEKPDTFADALLRPPMDEHSYYMLRRGRLEAARAIATHTVAEWHQQCIEQDGRCYYCGGPQVHLVKEHKTPIARGGSDGIDNIVASCRRCNLKKGVLTAPEYIHLLRLFHA